MRLQSVVEQMNISNARMVAVLLNLLLVFVVQAKGQETKVKWFGHAAFSITTPNGKVLLIDPWLNNPSNPDTKSGQWSARRSSLADH